MSLRCERIGLVLLALLAGRVTAATEADVLLAATLRPADVTRVVAHAADWWPLYPEDNVNLTEKLPGEQFFVVQTYHQVRDPNQLSLESVLTRFDTEVDARRGLLAMTREYDAGGTEEKGVDLGVQARWFTRAGDGSNERTVRFRVGAVVGRLTTRSKAQPIDAATMAAWVRPVLAHLVDYRQGQLTAPAIPPEWQKLLPPASVEKVVGPVLGTALVPVEAWAAVDNEGSHPLEAGAMLHELGGSRMLYRRYRLAAVSGQVIEVTVAPLRDAEAAAKWTATFTAQPQKGEPLDAGKTGPCAAFWLYGEKPKNYELQFAKGHYSVDIIGYSPYVETSTALQGPVRALAEALYAALPGQ